MEIYSRVPRSTLIGTAGRYRYIQYCIGRYLPVYRYSTVVSDVPGIEWEYGALYQLSGGVVYIATDTCSTLQYRMYSR